MTSAIAAQKKAMAKRAMADVDTELVDLVNDDKVRRFRRITGNAPRWREMRRAILAQIIADDPNHAWSTPKMAQAMRNHPLVTRIQPDYHQTTAHRDWLIIKNELADKRTEFASEYIGKQLDILGEIVDDFYDEYIELDRVELSDLSPDLRAQWLEKKIRLKEKLLKGMDRAFKRQAALIPINVPKQTNIRTTTVNMNIDQFLAMRQAALEPIAGDVVEGVVAEDDTD